MSTQLIDTSTTPPEFPFEAQIEQILEDLDDYRIVLTMEELKMAWPCRKAVACGASETDEIEMRAPTRAELRAWVATKLRAQAQTEHDGHCITGGFMTMKLRDRLSIYFIPFHAEAQADSDEMLIRVNLPEEIAEKGAAAHGA